MRLDGLLIWKCNGCGLAYVDPRPSSDQLSKYYEDGYFTGKRKGFTTDYCVSRHLDMKNGTVPGYSEIVENFDLQDKSILDIGCASGTLLQSLRRLNPAELIGIDTAQYPIDYGRDRYSLDLRCTTMNSAEFDANSFDLITMVDVIEHVENLPSFFQEIVRVLKDSGRIFLGTPNFASFSMARDLWSSLYTSFEHLFYLSPTSLSEVCRRNGLEVLKLWTRDQPFELVRYPKLHNMGLQRFFHPLIATKNFRLKWQFARRAAHQPDLGASLYAILGKAQSQQKLPEKTKSE
jgi:2-polyprenyl-3-methyl-5-hydroxy-6-metoxy-1,4-benzoquinol methylase